MTKRNATQRDWKAISLLGERAVRTGSISTGKEQAYKDIVGHVDRSLSGKGGVDVVVECSCWTVGQPPVFFVAIMVLMKSNNK